MARRRPKAPGQVTPAAGAPPSGAPAAAQTSVELFQEIIEFLPDATFVIDRDKRIIAWNQAIEAMTGRSKAELLGRGD